MRITVLHRGKQYAADVPWETARQLIESLKRARARFDASTKTWHADVLPCDVAKAFGAGECAEVRRCLAESERRNALIAELVREAPKPVLVLTSLVKHAKEIGDVVKETDSKLRVSVVTGAVKGSVRQAVYDVVRRGEVDVLVATTLADEGLDLPPLRSAVIALGGRSKTRVLQRIGRLVRPWPGKDVAVAYDVWDSAPYFDKQGEERYALYKTEPAWRVEVAKRP